MLYRIFNPLDTNHTTIQCQHCGSKYTNLTAWGSTSRRDLPKGKDLVTESKYYHCIECSKMTAVFLEAIKN